MSGYIGRGYPVAVDDNSVETDDIIDGAVSLAKMTGGTSGELITYDTAGDPAKVAVGTSGHVLTSGGAGVAPTFQATSLDGLTDAINDGSSVGIGTNALLSNTASSNTAIGTSALQFTNTGSGNTASGKNVLRFNTTGSFNTAVGYQSMLSNLTGSYSTAMGHYTLYTNTTGVDNTAIGAYALWKNLTGSYNTASGNSALQDNTTGQQNTATGRSSLRFNTTGSFNTASGMHALYANTAGAHNTASGVSALQSNTTGYNNTASGVNAMLHNTTGFNNVANGKSALHSNTTGSENTANGTDALKYNTTGANNTATGREALYTNTDGQNNTASGAYSLKANTTGSFNVANGMYALKSNTTGTGNAAFGTNVMYSNTTGYDNTTIGAYALLSNTTGIQNTASGKSALFNNTTGANNTALGHSAGDNITTGSSNIIIGSGVDAPSTTGSNQLNIGNWIKGTDGYIEIPKSIKLGDDTRTAATAGAGTVRWNGGKLQNSDGSAWKDVSYEPLGSSAAAAASSAKAIIDAGDSQGDGTYWIDIGGTSTQVYCDMTQDGGGWMLFGFAGETGSKGSAALVFDNIGTLSSTLPGYGGTSFSRFDLAKQLSGSNSSDEMMWYYPPADNGLIHSIDGFYSHIATGNRDLNSAGRCAVGKMTQTGNSGWITRATNTVGYEWGPSYPGISWNIWGSNSDCAGSYTTYMDHRNIIYWETGTSGYSADQWFHGTVLNLRESCASASASASRKQVGIYYRRTS